MGLFFKTKEETAKDKAGFIATSPLWDGGSSDEILRKYTPEQIDKIHAEIERDEDFIDCMFF